MNPSDPCYAIVAIDLSYIELSILVLWASVRSEES